MSCTIDSCDPVLGCRHASILAPLSGLVAARSGAGGAELSFAWGQDPLGSGYHLNRVTDKRHVASPGAHRPDVPGSRGLPLCDATDLGCTVLDAGVETGRVAYCQAHSACGPRGVHEGP